MERNEPIRAELAARACRLLVDILAVKLRMKVWVLKL